jgi:hypothetical protein
MAGTDRIAALEARLVALEAQVQRLTDELELHHLTASYAAAVDSGSAQVAAELWTEDGVYDVDVVKLHGRMQIAGMVETGIHQELIHNGCGHVISMPRITIDGDRAVGTCHSRLYRREGDAFVMWRVAANRWEYRRTPQGWRIEYRTNRLLDGSEDGRALLRRAFEDPNQSLRTKELTDETHVGADHDGADGGR